MSKRNYYRYNLKEGQKIVYKGITKNPEQRADQHKDEGKKFTHMQIIGPAVTEDTAENGRKKVCGSIVMITEVKTPFTTRQKNRVE